MITAYMDEEYPQTSRMNSCVLCNSILRKEHITRVDDLVRESHKEKHSLSLTIKYTFELITVLLGDQNDKSNEGDIDWSDKRNQQLSTEELNIAISEHIKNCVACYDPGIKALLCHYEIMALIQNAKTPQQKSTAITLLLKTL